MVFFPSPLPLSMSKPNSKPKTPEARTTQPTHLPNDPIEPRKPQPKKSPPTTKPQSPTRKPDITYKQKSQ